MTKKMSQIRRHNEKGFTLVETLVAITVLLLVIIGPITVAQKGIQTAYYANEQVSAVFLAQEAIESLRALRDDAALSAYNTTGGGNTWNWMGSAVIPSVCTNGTGCAYDVESDTFESCGTNNNCRLRIDASGRYTYAVGTDSPFTRKLYIDNSAADRVSVRVEVTWPSTLFGGSTIRTVKLETWLYDHYQRYED